MWTLWTLWRWCVYVYSYNHTFFYLWNRRHYRHYIFTFFTIFTPAFFKFIQRCLSGPVSASQAIQQPFRYVSSCLTCSGHSAPSVKTHDAEMGSYHFVWKYFRVRATVIDDLGDCPYGDSATFGILEFKKILSFLAMSLKRRKAFPESFFVVFILWFYFFSIVSLFPTTIVLRGRIVDIISHFMSLLFGIVIFSLYSFTKSTKKTRPYRLTRDDFVLLFLRKLNSEWVIYFDRMFYIELWFVFMMIINEWIEI